MKLLLSQRLVLLYFVCLQYFAQSGAALLCTSLYSRKGLDHCRLRTLTCPKNRMHTVRRSREDSRSDVFLKREEFDLLSFRSWRRETLFKYSNANQSEPLRIILFLLLSVSLIFAPAIADAIGAPPPEPVGAYVLAGAGSVALLARERGQRTKKLLRLEREGIVADLRLNVKKNILVGGEQVTSIRALRNEKRVLAITASAKDLERLEMLECAPLQRRLDAARTVVVPVPIDGKMQRFGTSYAEPTDVKAWRKVFQVLLTADEAWGPDFAFEEENRAAFFLIGLNGRSVASGQGLPRLLELLGSRLPPIDPIQPEPRILDFGPQATFYKALTSGDVQTMSNLFGDEDDSEVTATVTAGGRLDPWTNQLAPDARPSELIVGDADLTVFDDLAITTAIEQNGPDPFRTLLATQKWIKVKDSDDDWRLLSHATVPFAPSATAAALLRCDHRGCVLLVNQQQQQQ